MSSKSIHIKTTAYFEDQTEVIACLTNPESYKFNPKMIEQIETHGALIFLVGNEVFKIKKSVKFPYMDFSNIELRKQACFNELKINKPYAPEIYVDVIPITRQASGQLSINGNGIPVEWVVHMRRFKQDHILNHLADKGDISDTLIKRIASIIADYHDQAPISDKTNTAKAFSDIINNLGTEFGKIEHTISSKQSADFISLATKQLSEVKTCLDHRSEEGFVRRCHGDLHLKNIVEIDGEPVLFDAIEFDEEIATIDTLYDLAFIVMDLWQRNLRHEANLLLNYYLYYSNQISNLYALKALPLFLACRAGIRVMVTAEHIAQIENDNTSILRDMALEYFHSAMSYLKLSAPKLICIGGLSGTGKTTLAMNIAPSIGNAPGALVLRSDQERKSFFSVEETDHLKKQHYTSKINEKIYNLLLEQAKIALMSGHSVIIDAVFSQSEQRETLEELAKKLKVPFIGFWLEVPEAISMSRVAERIGDASDATPEIVKKQYEQDIGHISWHIIDASRSVTDTLIETNKVLKAKTDEMK